jgi:hypothetical protein
MHKFGCLGLGSVGRCEIDVMVVTLSNIVFLETDTLERINVDVSLCLVFALGRGDFQFPADEPVFGRPHDDIGASLTGGDFLLNPDSFQVKTGEGVFGVLSIRERFQKVFYESMTESVVLVRP